MALDWFKCWLVINSCSTQTNTHQSSEFRLFMSLPLPTVSFPLCPRSSFSHKTSWLCVSAALTGTASQLTARRHAARLRIGSDLCNHSCSAIWGATPPAPSNHTYTESLVAKGSLDVESRASSRVRTQLTEHKQWHL